MRFYSTYTNRRHKSYGAGVDDNSSVHTRGWNAGVKVTVNGGNAPVDRFDVYMTTGSHASGSDKLLGYVLDTPDGPLFVAAFPVDDNAPDYVTDETILEAQSERAHP